MKSTRFTNAFIFIFAVLLITGCSKKKTFDINLHVQSEITGEPIANAQVQLAYFKDKEGESDMQTIELGLTDANGNISAKDKIKGKAFNHTVRIFAEGYGKRIAANLAYKLPIEAGKTVDQTIRMRPVYHYVITMDDQVCFTEHDTAWVTGPNGLEGKTIGCDPVILHYKDYPGYDFTYWNTVPEITFNITVRRGTGFISSTVTKTLVEQQVTPVLLTY